jgi:RAB protein geranylgeranyltransferase component A
MANIYLDIDGVLLANDLNPAKHVHEFLEKVVSNHDVYWLTTHCKGDASTAYKRLSLVLKPRTMELLKDVKATDWDTAKTEAIDFSQPFLWFDDDLFHDEKQALIKHGVLDNWIEVDLAKDEDQLAKFVSSFPLPTGNLV